MELKELLGELAIALHAIGKLTGITATAVVGLLPEGDERDALRATIKETAQAFDQANRRMEAKGIR